MLGLLLRLLRPRRKSWRQRSSGRYGDQPKMARERHTSLPRSAEPKPSTLRGKCYVIDGDTIVIDGTHIRLAGIDAPELDQPWGKKAKFAMIAMCKGQTITAQVSDSKSYDRLVAHCFLPDGTDLSAALVQQGLALDWKRFSGGAYRHLEPADARKKLWRVDAKHKGRFPAPVKAKPAEH